MTLLEQLDAAEARLRALRDVERHMRDVRDPRHLADVNEASALCMAAAARCLVTTEDITDGPVPPEARVDLSVIAAGYGMQDHTEAWLAGHAELERAGLLDTPARTHVPDFLRRNVTDVGGTIADNAFVVPIAEGVDAQQLARYMRACICGAGDADFGHGPTCPARLEGPDA
jgi:hypothetical protein